MKRCPFCAEEIQEAAIVCRFCGRDLEAPPPFPKTPNVVLWAKGARYYVGAIVDERGDVRRFGVWDGEQPGPPIERFELSKDGREGALARFRQLEPGDDIRQNPDPPACPRCGSDMRWANGSDRTADLVAGVAIFGILGALGDRKRFACPNCRTRV